MQIDIQLIHPEAKMPLYATDGASGFDLHAVIDPDHTLHPRRRSIKPGEQLLINTGVAFEIPEGFGLFLLSRSGHGKKNSVRLANCVGLGDPDFRDAIGVILRNDGKETFFVNHGDRIAQAVVMATPRCTFVVKEQLSETARGLGSFGHTGV